METYDITSDIYYVTEKVFEKFMDMIPTTKPNKHPQIIENAIKDILRVTFTDYSPIDRAEIYNYVSGLKILFTSDRYRPKSLSCIDLIDILSHGTRLATDPDGIIIIHNETLYAIGFICEFDLNKRAKIIPDKKLSLQKLLTSNSSTHSKEPGKIFLIDPIAPDLETIPYKKSLSIPSTKTIENKELSNYGSIIIIDKEGQFNERFQDFQNATSKYSKDKVPIYNYKLYKDSTFSQKEIEWVNNIQYFMPSLTDRVYSNLKTALRQISEKKPILLSTLKADIDQEIRENFICHSSVKQSMYESINVFDSTRKIIFDQPEKTPIGKNELLKPGIIILDISKYPDDEKIYATAATMCILHNSITPEDNYRAHLVIDEASFFFPKSPSSSNKEFYERITQFAKTITRDGRKRHYGITFANQNPKDIHSDLIDPCITKISFGHGDKRWTKNRFPDAQQPKNPGEIILTTENITSLNSIIETINITDTIGRQNIARIQNDPDQVVGYLHPTEAHAGHAKNEKIIYPGYSQGDNTKLIYVNDLLKSISEDTDSAQKILTYWRVNSIQNISQRYNNGLQYSKNSVAHKSSSSFAEEYSLEPIKQIIQNNNSSATVRRFQHGQYLFNLTLCLPNIDDFNLAYNLPKSGIMLGVHQNTLIPIYLPFDRDNTRDISKDWLLDKSMYIVGFQGTGKTNLLVYLFYQLVHPNPSKIAEFLIDQLGDQQ